MAGTSTGASVGSSAATGAAAGSMFGPWGTVAGGVIGAVAGLVAANSSKKAAKSAQQQQEQALTTLMKYTNEQMDPALVNKQATEADIARAKAQLALQEQIDPALARIRQSSAQSMEDQLAQFGKSPSDTLAALSAKEATAGTPGLDAVKQQLVAAAMKEIEAGASLPSDLQAELMQAGLQRAGQVTGGASGGSSSMGSSILNQVLGSAGINLRKQRLESATSLATAASNLESQRQQILQGLFPKLQQQQLGNLSAASGALTQSNAMAPNVGLSGADVSNIWLARVGAMNQLGAQLGQVKSTGTMAIGQANANMWGNIASLGQSVAQSPSFFNSTTKSTTGNVDLQKKLAGGIGAG